MSEPIPETFLPRCGDHVFHRPSGETWSVAWCEGDDLAWSGWPNGMARTADCEIVYRSSDLEHRKAAQEVAACDDSRGPRVRRLYAEALSIPPTPTTPQSPPALAEMCSTCQGNGEVVTDWERYLHAQDGDVGDEAVADCPDCDGIGLLDATISHSPWSGFNGR